MNQDCTDLTQSGHSAGQRLIADCDQSNAPSRVDFRCMSLLGDVCERGVGR